MGTKLGVTKNFVSSLYLLIQSSTLKRCIEHCLMALATLLHVYIYLVFTKSVDSNFCAFWLARVTRNILGYSLFCDRREKWRVVSRKFLKKKLKQHFFYPSDLVNAKTTMPLMVGEDRWIYTETLRGISRFQIRRPNLSATPPPSSVPCANLTKMKTHCQFILINWNIISPKMVRNSILEK